MNKPLVSVIILSYNSRRYIQKCMDTLLLQDYPNMEILLVINGSEDGSKELIKSNYWRYRKVRIIEPGNNLWFSKGNNMAIKQSRGEFILTLNQDTVLEPNFLSRLVEPILAQKTLGSVTGKLFHYKFDIDSKTKILDSTGMEIFKTRRVIDRGQWERDSGDYDADVQVFGASGAAALYRRSALESVKIQKADGEYEYFDEDFVAYKEDVDLAWRLQLAGWGCEYVPGAVIYHGRTIGRSWPSQLIRFVLNRHHQPWIVRRLSFKNHYLMMVKNEVKEIFWRHFVYILFREILLLLYTLIFEPFQVTALWQFFKDLPEARRKRQLVMAKVKSSPERLRKLFH
ncbi:MAG: glycosyltransferase family 2 protein [bacterium]|nr:glycosyltransferase family 2 protein [bacterium]